MRLQFVSLGVFLTSLLFLLVLFQGYTTEARALDKHQHNDIDLIQQFNVRERRQNFDEFKELNDFKYDGKESIKRVVERSGKKNSDESREDDRKKHSSKNSDESGSKNDDDRDD